MGAFESVEASQWFWFSRGGEGDMLWGDLKNLPSLSTKYIHHTSSHLNFWRKIRVPRTRPYWSDSGNQVWTAISRWVIWCIVLVHPTSQAKTWDGLTRYMNLGDLTLLEIATSYEFLLFEWSQIHYSPPENLLDEIIIESSISSHTMRSIPTHAEW